MLDKKNSEFYPGQYSQEAAIVHGPHSRRPYFAGGIRAVDLLVVGRFGSTSGLSAVSTGSQVLNLVTFVVTQLAMGITVLIARYLGEKKPQQIGPVLGGAALVFALISVVLCIVLVCFARPISVLMQAPAESLDLTVSYVRICGSGIFFIVAYNVLSANFPGTGRQPVSASVRPGGLCGQHFRGSAAGSRVRNGRSGRGSRHGHCTGRQRGLRGGLALEKGAAVHLQPKRYPAESPVPQIPGRRLAPGAAGVLDAAVLPGAVRLCESPGLGGFLRVRRGQQDRQLRHADPQRPHAVHGVLVSQNVGRRAIPKRVPSSPCLPGSVWVFASAAWSLFWSC